MSIDIAFGALCPPLSEQLPAGVIPVETLDHLQRDADAITRLAVRGLLTAVQVHAARSKLVEKIAAASAKTGTSQARKHARNKTLQVVDRDGVALVCESGRHMALARFTGPDRRAQAEEHARFMMENRRLTAASPAAPDAEGSS